MRLHLGLNMHTHKMISVNLGIPRLKRWGVFRLQMRDAVERYKGDAARVSAVMEQVMGGFAVHRSDGAKPAHVVCADLGPESPGIGCSQQAANSQVEARRIRHDRPF